mmetsp:Transcript_90742/g.277809  ORF Transcript_90742/g.277809 Transcript_90742/m.277809 type:complete len:246 (-) Transcript_90742:24-761(-)
MAGPLIQRRHRRHHRVDGVDDEADDGAGAELRARLDDALRDARVGLEEVVPRHARLAREARRHQDEMAARQTLLEVVDGVLAHLHDVALHRALALQVAKVRGDARRGDHGHVQIEYAQLTHVRIHAHQQRQRLADAAGPPADANLEAAGGCLAGLGLGLGLRLGIRLALALALALRRLACLPIRGDGRLLVRALVKCRKLVVRVGLAVLGVNALVGHLRRATQKAALTECKGRCARRRATRGGGL